MQIPSAHRMSFPITQIVKSGEKVGGDLLMCGVNLDCFHLIETSPNIRECGIMAEDISSIL
jgi:hypothetical protein